MAWSLKDKKWRENKRRERLATSEGRLRLDGMDLIVMICSIGVQTGKSQEKKKEMDCCKRLK